MSSMFAKVFQVIRFFVPAIALVGVISPVARADVKIFTVSSRAGQGTHTDIQKAINDCAPIDICTINLVDSSYLLSRPIWIEGKNNLAIVANRTGSKPLVQFLPALLTRIANPNTGKGGTPPAQVARLFTLPFLDPVTGVADPKRPAGWMMWPFEGSTSDLPLAGADPGHTNDTTTGYSSSGFQYNGMFVVHKSQDVTIRGIALKSQPTFFQNRRVWSAKYDVLLGNVGVNMNQSLRTKVQDCDISGFFAAFYIQGRNVGGAFGRANVNDLDDADIVPLSRFGQIGDHLIERNYVSNNWWFAYNEIDWDIGSTIRYNVAFQNMNKSFQYGDTLTDPASAGDELNNMTGGFMYAKDAVVIPHRMYNNTILSSPIVLGHGYWRTNVQSLFYNNVISFVNLSTGAAAPVGAGDQHNLLGWYGEMAWNNTIQLMPGLTSVKYKAGGDFEIRDAGVTGHYGVGSNCGGGCYLNGVVLPTPYISEMQPNSLFNEWGIEKGVSIEIKGEDLPWSATATGYQGKTFTIRETNGYALWGRFNKLPGIDTAAARRRENFWAIKLPTQGNIDSNTTTVATVMALAPKWGEPAITATIRNKAWRNTDLGGPDGSISDRGAFQYDSLSGRTVLGGIRNGVQLDVVDQRIVDMKGLRVKIPMIVQQLNGDQVVPGYYTDIRVDSVNYYPTFPFSSVTEGDATMKPWGPATVIKGSAFTWSGRSGDSLTFNVGTAVTADYGRFDVFVSALDPVSGLRVRTVGSYVYRKADYKLVVDFCTDGTSAATCAASLVTRTRVGETVQMRIRITDANDVLTPAQVVSNLMVTPGAGGRMVNVTTGGPIDTSIFRASFTGSLIAPVQFLSVGQNDVGAAGVVGAVGSAKGILGAGTIFVAAGPPYRVQWVDPASTSVVPCIPNPSTGAMDTTTFCGDELAPSGLTAADLRVFDRFGNQVTEAASVRVTASNLNNPLLQAASPRGIGKVAAAVGGVAVDSVVIRTDSTGRGSVWITGSASVLGTYPKGWVQFLARVDSVNLPTDTTRVRLGKPAMKLFWAKPVRIDTTIRTSVPVRLVASLDTLPVATGAYATAVVRVWPSQSRSIVFYRDAARTLPVLDSQVTLVGGQITLWVASDVATPVNSLFAELPGLPGIPEYTNVRFFVPPPPPSPVPGSAAFLDRDCDGKADVVRLQLKASGATPAALDTTKVKPEAFLVTYDNGTIDTVRANGWRAVGGDFSLLDLTLAKAPVKSDLIGTVVMVVRLRRPPADDTLIVAGAAVPVADQIAPRPVSGAIIENFSPGVVADTIRVAFSEAVTYTGTTWPFLTRNPSTGLLVNTAGLSVTTIAAAPGSMTFVVTGNVGGTVVRAGYSIAIDSASTLVDASGNRGKGSECLGDTAILALVPQPVPMVSSAISDLNGDGAAERVRITFRRALRAVDIPDSLVLTWGGLSLNTNLVGAVTADSITWVITLPASFPKGLTKGNLPGGVGQVTLIDGAGATLRTQAIAMADSVGPIPVAAELAYGLAGATDTLYVNFSEGLSKVTGTSWMLDKRLADAPIAASNGFRVGADSIRWAFLVDPASANYPRPGDSVRLPSGAASNLADALGNLPTSPTSPYVAVVGPAIRLARAAIRDVDGNGTADRLSLVFLRPLQALDVPDSLRVVWGGETRLVTLAGAVTTDSVSWIVSLSTPFTKGLTAGGNANGSGTVRLRKGVRNEPTDLQDSVAPIPVRARLGYGLAGARDTLVVKYSESLDRRAGSSWMLDQQLGDAPLSILSGTVIAGDSTNWAFLLDPAGTSQPRPGDSIRLPAGAASNLLDVRGNLPSAPTSPYVVVQGPPIPMVSAYLTDSDGDGRADRVVATFLKRLRSIDIPDSLLVEWGAESRKAIFAGATTLDSATWTISVASFAKGVTSGALANGSGVVTLKLSTPDTIRSERTSLADSVAAIPVSAELRYDPVGGMDSLVVTYSEALASRIGSAWMLRQRGGDVSIGASSGVAQSADGLTWLLLVPSSSAGFARPGDSIRLPSGVASSLADARGVLPTAPISPYVVVRGGDRPPVKAWYRDADGDGKVDLAVLEFSEPLVSNPSYLLGWAGETRTADSSLYGGSAIGLTRLEIRLSQPFTFGLTSSPADLSFGVQTSGSSGAVPAVSRFPIQDSVPPVILTARVGYNAYNTPGARDTMFLKLSEPVVASGFTVILGRGGDGGAYPIGFGRSEVVNLVSVGAGDSLVFYCDTSCIEQISAAGMPNNGDSVRLSMPQGGILVRDLLGNAPGAEAKWTKVTAGDRPYNYTVRIFPKGILDETAEGYVPDPTLKSKPTISVWVFKDGKWLEFKDGKLTGDFRDAGTATTPGVLERNGVGLRIEINSAFQSSVLMYDNIGVHVGNADIAIDSTMAKALGNSAGKFSILIYFNGRKDQDMSKILGSGVYLLRYLTFRDELQANGARQRKLIENKVYRIGLKNAGK
jgi:hypothetical protein